MKARLGIKDLRFILAGLETLKENYSIEYDLYSDKKDVSELGNDIKFIECLSLELEQVILTETRING